LACLQADDLRHACAAADALGAPCFVSDSAGTGTTAFFSPAGTTFKTAFGHRSRAQHRASGIQELGGPGLTSLHRDIDTAADLWDAQRIGLGRHSLAVISTSTQQ
jgi:2-phospho-L-lactate guanylyltransferase